MSSRFYFNSEDDRTELDPDGTELANIEEGQKEALALLGRLLQDAEGRSLWQGKAWRVWVTDGPNGAGNLLFDLQVSANKPNAP